MVSFTKIQFENICRVLHEISTGNLGYRLRFSESDEYYNLQAKYLNLIGEIYTPYLVELAKHDKKANFPIFLEIHLREDLMIREVSHNIFGLLGKNPGDYIGLSFRDLLTEESLKGWKKLKSNFYMPTPVQFGTRFNFQVNHWLYYSCFCYITGQPDGSFKVTSQKNEKYRDVNAMMRDMGLSNQKGNFKHSRFTITEAETNKNRDKENLQNLLQFMEEHLEEPTPDMKSLAHRFGFNEKKLVKHFKMAYNQTPYAYYINKKMQRAMNLLQTTHLGIEDVAASVGYPTKSSFYKAFKKKFGIPPGAVKREI